MASPYSLGADDKLPQLSPELLQMGMKALQSGAVSPQQAAAAYKGFSPYRDPAAAGDEENARVNSAIAATNAGQAQANQDQMMAQSGALKMPQVPSVSAKAPKSGLSSKVQAKNTAEQKTTSSKTIPIDPEVYAQMKSAAENAPAYKNLEAGQAGLEQLLRDEQNKQEPMSYTRPLAMLADAWTGSHMTSALPKAEQPDERDKRIMDYAQKLQQDRKAIVDSYLNSVKAQKGGTVINLNGATQSANAENDAKDPLSGIRQMPEERKLIALNSHASKQLDSLQKERDAVQNGLSRLSSASSAEDMLAVDGLVRAAIGGRITNYDQQRQAAGDQSLSERLKQMIQKAAHGDLDPHNRAMYAQALESMGKDIESEIGGRLQQVRGFGNALDISPDKIDKTLSPYGRTLPKAEGEAKKAIESEKAKKSPAAASKAGSAGGLQSIDDYFNSKGGK